MTNRHCFGKSNYDWMRLLREGGALHRQPSTLSDLYQFNGIDFTTTCHYIRKQLNQQMDERQQSKGHCSRLDLRNSKPREVFSHGPFSSTKQNTVGREPDGQIHTTLMRLVWLQADQIQRPKVTTLLNRFDSEGMDIHIVDLHQEKKAPPPLHCELVMLECINTLETEMLTQLSSVRSQSQVPLIVLTDNHTLDWSLLALREGADAIFTLNTPDDIIIARSNALLRRWITGS